MPALYLDVGCLCDAHTDSALEHIYKAIGEDPPGDDIWAPHPNPYVQRILELITDRGLRRHAGLEAELRTWLQGGLHQASAERIARPAGVMARWSPVELGLVRTYLSALPQDAWTLDDWMMLVDYLVHRYLPLDDLRTEAEWTATRSNLLGRVQAAAADPDVPGNLDPLLSGALDDAIRERLGMTLEQRAAIDFGRARCAEHVAAFADAARHRLRNIIMNWQEAVYLGVRADAAEDLRTVLLDQFGTMNRDWRRIAVTEVTENSNQGFVGAQPPGTKLKRVEKYRGACKFCRDIDGRVVTVVEASKPDKNGDTEIWVGKTNVGRSAAPRRRVGGDLIDREPHEMWWLAAGAMHPHCRGRWIKVGGASEDPEFDAWLDNMKKRRGAPA